jgi:hypothetical protein
MYHKNVIITYFLIAEKTKRETIPKQWQRERGMVDRNCWFLKSICNNIEIKITKLSMTPSLKFIVDFEYTGVFSPNCTVFLIIGIFGGYSPLEVVWL